MQINRRTVTTNFSLMDISRGVSFVGGLIVLGAGVLVTATGGERVVEGFASLSSSDGLTRILSPVVIVLGLLDLAFGLAGVAPSRQTLGSTGRRQAAAPVAGLLTAMGAGLTFTAAPATDWQFQAFALPLAVIGTGIAAGGWLLGWTSQDLLGGATALHALGAVGTAALVTLPLAIGVLMAPRTPGPRFPSANASRRSALPVPTGTTPSSGSPTSMWR